MRSKEFSGEFLGTFIMVFFGCGSVAAAVLFGMFSGIFQIALIWGIAVILGIYMTRHLSDAHFNPAVTLAMVVAGRMSHKKMVLYFSAQFSGAFAAAFLLYGLFSGSIENFELMNGIIRGAPDSVGTASIFGEFYPNPGAGVHASVTYLNAFFAEFTGTAFLVLFILLLTEEENIGGPGIPFAPVFIGFGLAIIISILAPFTQGGFNPARDFSPRLFSILAGWGKAAMPDKNYGFIVIYILSPFMGGTVAALLSRYIIRPLYSGVKTPS